MPFEHLGDADLIVDQVYAGGSKGNVSDDPISRLLSVGNMGGFRYSGSLQQDSVRVIVLYTSGDHVDWPDSLDLSTGTFTYYGDNRSPGHDLHDTPHRGNQVLRMLFERANGGLEQRKLVPPVFVFSKGDQGRSVVFRGLATPGSNTGRVDEDLVAVWRTSRNERFQNYRSVFTILDDARIDRKWLSTLDGGSGFSGAFCPASWKNWIMTGVARPLMSERLDTRSKVDQLPDTKNGWAVIDAVHQYFNVKLNRPTDFEKLAVDLWRTSAPSTAEVNLTRPWRDGGRDAIGTYGIGPNASRLAVEFALEAKCYSTKNSVGVRDMSRLISRLRHRQFGVFITTSYFDRQVYQEVVEDEHPVVLMAARDAVEALNSFGISTGRQAMEWLEHRYPGLP